MKVLFAVSNEEISESIVKKYQKEYKQIISYKNVYYFNAILKELQKDKTYDRVVISEDLEAFTHTQYDQIDKFIFEKMDSISDEASDVKGNDTPIIVICADRRTKSEPMLVKLFGIGIYNAIIGNDRSVDEVCRLINRPRTKKEAKAYYKIDSEDVGYQAENENDVSEMEIQNIVAHYKRLGKNEERYIDSFNNIAAQYNDTQLRIITKFLPLNVRAVLEERSSKYQQIMSFNNAVSDSLRKNKNEEESDGPSQVLLKSKNRDTVLSKPVVIPSAVNMSGTKKLAKHKPVEPMNNYEQPQEQQVRPTIQPNIRQPEPQKVETSVPMIEGLDDFEDFVPEPMTQEPVNQKPVIQEPVVQAPVQERIEPVIEQPVIKEPVVQETIPTEPVIEGLEEPTTPEPVQPVKRGRGRPRKNPIPTEQPDKPKRGRGRPRKNPLPVQEEVVPVQEPVQEEMVLPGLEPQEQTQIPESNFLPGFEEVEVPAPQTDTTIETERPDPFLPGFGNEEPEENNMVLPGFEDEEPEENNIVLPGFGEEEPEIQKQPSIPQQHYDTPTPDPFISQQELAQSEPEPFMPNNNYETNSYNHDNYNRNSFNPINTNNHRELEESYEEIDLSNLLTPDKKIVTFVGTSKNGTSFIVNNVAELLSSIGINVAVLDTTQNRNSYYIYTKNEEDLREIATHSIEGLAQGVARGIEVHKNLTVYTSLPDDENTINHVDKILETLLQKHSLILIDTDFNTPRGYFKQSQETYLVQSMDILTIQPLTAFLKELKAKNILDERKLRIVLNKVVKIRGIKPATIIGGMAFYNDPAMSFMTELFDRDRIKYVSIPFEEETYIRYLEGIIECEISQKGYSKIFLQTLRELGNMIYPIVTSAPRNNKNYQPPSAGANGGGNFSSSMNDTLNKMRGF